MTKTRRILIVDDGVIRDLRMPGMNGMGFHQAICAKYGNLPFLLTTAYEDQDLIAQAKQEGVHAFQEKPLDIARVLLWIGAIL